MLFSMVRVGNGSMLELEIFLTVFFFESIETERPSIQPFKLVNSSLQS